jgi:lysozyme family protein
VAARLAAPAAKARYQAIEAKTGVPWFFIAVTHQRESSQDWSRSLAQGDPWNKKSTHVPAGRGPFASFEDAAVDALKNCAPYAAKNTDWTVGGLLTMLEQYNGLGYYNKGLPSPYIWSGTDQYVKGKYIADGKFDPNTVDKQLGCAGLILAMQAIDPSITFDGDKPAPDPVTPSPPVVALPPLQPAPATSGIAALLASILSIFKRG